MALVGPFPASSSPAAGVFDWQEAIARHDRRVVVALLARGLRLERARELAQETWLRLIERQREGRLPEIKLPGLAIAQALFFAKDELRRDQLRTGSGGPADSGGDGPATPSLEQRLIERESLARAAHALATCSPASRRVFELCYQQPELSHAEAAAQLGLSTQRVRQTLCEVRKVLRRAIEDDHHD